MVECQLPKLEVAGSSPVIRSRIIHAESGTWRLGIFVPSLYPVGFNP